MRRSGSGQSLRQDRPPPASGKTLLINPPQQFHKTKATRPLISTETMQRRHFASPLFSFKVNYMKEKSPSGQSCSAGYGGNVELWEKFFPSRKKSKNFHFRGSFVNVRQTQLKDISDYLLSTVRCFNSQTLQSLADFQLES